MYVLYIHVDDEVTTQGLALDVEESPRLLLERNVFG